MPDFRVYIITLSDSGARGERTDESGPLIQELCEAQGFKTAGYCLLPDDREKLAAELRRVCDGHLADLVLTTGGTGFAPTDVTPEATLDVVERPVPGIPEALRINSLKYTDRSMLSRAAAGIRKETLIVNLPGSPRAVRENLTYLFGPLEHGLMMLTGREHNCARPDGGSHGSH